MINNRQNGRRRGRGGGAPRPNGSGNADRGSRIDNRARGNASQLYEKYKTLARDAQMQGDRVNTEFYLQFADHYFRVLSEHRARFEEVRRPRDDYQGGQFDQGGEDQGEQDSQEDYEEEGEGSGEDRGSDQAYDRPVQQQHRSNRYEGERNERQERRPRQPAESRDGWQQRDDRNGYNRDRDGGGNGQAPTRAEAPQPPLPLNVEESGVEKPRRGRPRRVRPEDETPQRIEVDRLPPSFSPERAETPAPTAAAQEEAPPRPRRGRPRRVQPDSDAIVDA